tara:strand:+ start:959 stop:1099 length:141 start_codon:yes stop_codon:yes gene_type:complete
VPHLLKSFDGQEWQVLEENRLLEQADHGAQKVGKRRARLGEAVRSK